MWVQAVVIHEPGRFGLEDLPVPEPGLGEVRVRSQYVGVCRTDLELIRGQLPPEWVKYPLIPGHEWSGEVDKLGPGVDGFALGDRVIAEGIIPCGTCPKCRRGETNLCDAYDELGFTRPGGYGQYVIVPARVVHHVPPAISSKSAALIEPTAVVARGVFRAQPKPSETVAIIGPGALGLLAVMLFRLFRPGRIILVGFGQAQLAFGQRLGASDIVDIETSNPGEQVRQITDGLGADIVFESAGHPAAVETAFAVARPGSRLVLAGVAGKGQILNLPSDIFVQKDLTVHGVFGYTSRVWQRVMDLVSAGLVDPGLVITHQLPLERFEHAFHLLDQRPPVLGRILLEHTIA
jgi:2-desacetyl-2-hydroxyethyl bacteriochlorophyllide A dehydrogenase